MKHTLVARVLDQPGVLNRIASLFRRRAFNIESLTVGHSEVPDVSRMTIVVDTARVPAHLVEDNLRKLVPVAEVHDVTHLPTVERELTLVRVACSPADRAEMASLMEIFRGRIVDVGADSLIVEVTGDVEKVDSLVELLRPRGILEMVRTGKVALLRGAAYNELLARTASDEPEAEADAEDGPASVN
jgi:acetolactate synthase-1/3 small subunit